MISPTKRVIIFNFVTKVITFKYKYFDEIRQSYMEYCPCAENIKPDCYIFINHESIIKALEDKHCNKHDSSIIRYLYEKQTGLIQGMRVFIINGISCHVPIGDEFLESTPFGSGSAFLVSYRSDGLLTPRYNYED